MATAALWALAGCRTAEQEAPETTRTVRFRAVGADTRTAFAAPEEGIYRTLWTENDEDILLSLNYGEACPSAVTAAQDGVTATFEATFDATTARAPFTFYAISPASAARAISPSRQAWSVSIAAEQTPLPASVDEAAQLLVAKSAATEVLPGDVDLHFSHLTAYGRVALRNLELGDAVVSKVDLIFGTPVVGEWYWAEDGTLTSNGASHTITLHTDASGDLWFACAPVDVSSTTLSINVYTDKGIFFKEIAFPAGRRFVSGKVARFTVDMTGIESAGTAGDDPLTAESGYGCYLQDQTWVYAKGSDQISRTYAADGTVGFTLLNAAEQKQLEVSGYDPGATKGSEVRVAVRYRIGRQVVSDDTFALTVVKEDGPKVWLGDGSGHGFIIKK